MSVVRAFVAAELSAAVREDLGRLAERLRKRLPPYRWVAPGTMHLTLKFLGEIPEETFEAAAREMERGFPVGGPLTLMPRGVGAFGSTRRARVLWVGLAGDAARLARLAAEVERRLEPLGIPREARSFSPHLTLARARGPVPDASRVLAAEAEYEGPAWTVGEIILFESRLRREGAEHVPRARGAVTGG